MILARYLHSDLRSENALFHTWVRDTAIDSPAGDRVEGVGLQRWGGELITLSVMHFAIR